MWQMPLRESSAQAERGADAHPSEEAALDRYLTRESPLRDFVAERLRQAPWWTISLLVHVIALLILWQWPIDLGPIEEAITNPVIAFRDFERPPPPIVEPPPKRPKDLPKIPEDFDIKPVLNTTPSDQPQAEVTPPPGPIKPEAPPEPPALVEPARIFQVINHTPLPVRTGNDLRQPRDGLRKKIEAPPSGEKGKIGGPISVPPIIAGLIWLAQAQQPDGHWDAKRWDGANSYSTGMTGLALLAFQGAGFTHQRGRFNETVRQGMEWLRKNQEPGGRFPCQTFYEHGIAAMAVCEAYSMTDDSRIRPMAQRAIDYICNTQPDHGGFRYGGAVAEGEGDMSVTGWQIMAIKSALIAKLNVPDSAVERSRTFLKNSSRDYGASAYLAGTKESGSLAVSAIGMLCRIFLATEEVSYADEIRLTATFLFGKETQNLDPVPGGASKQLVYDLYYTYYSSLAMFQQGTEYWRVWDKSYTAPLCDEQIKVKTEAGRYVKGSWDPAKHKWGKQGGRVYSTAMAVLCLEAPYRFLPIYRSRP